MKLILSSPHHEPIWFCGEAYKQAGSLGKIRLRTKYVKHFLALMNSSILEDQHLIVRRVGNLYQIDFPQQIAKVLNVDGSPLKL